MSSEPIFNPHISEYGEGKWHLKLKGFISLLNSWGEKDFFIWCFFFPFLFLTLLCTFTFVYSHLNWCCMVRCSDKTKNIYLYSSMWAGVVVVNLLYFIFSLHPLFLSLPSSLLPSVFFAVPGPIISCVLGKRSTTELHHQPYFPCPLHISGRNWGGRPKEKVGGRTMLGLSVSIQLCFLLLGRH